MSHNTDHKSLTVLFAVGLLALAVIFMPAQSMACGGKAKSTSSVQKASVDGKEAAPAQMANGTAKGSCTSLGTASMVDAATTGCPATGTSSTAKMTTANATGSCAGSSTTTTQQANAPSGCGTSTDATIMKANATSTNGNCTKEQCVAKLMAEGMTKADAEAKYAACMAGGKCSKDMAKTSTTMADASESAVPNVQEVKAEKNENQ